MSKMSKRFVSCVLAMAMMTSLAPSTAFAIDGSTESVSTTTENSEQSANGKVIEVNNAQSLKDAIENAADGTTITLLNDIDVNKTISINKSITIDGTNPDGGRFKITYTGNSGTNLFDVQSNGSIALQNLDGKISNGRLMALDSLSPHVSLKNCTFYVKERGISFVQDGIATAAELSLDNTQIRCTQSVTDDQYDTQAAVGDVRGISIFNVKNSKVELVNNSELSGFGYCINVSGTNGGTQIVDNSGLEITIEDSLLRGWTSFNVWGSFAKYNIIDSQILGINNSNGSSNSFSAITFNGDIYNQFDGLHAFANELFIKNSTIKNYQQNNGQDLITEEELLRIDNGITKLTFSGNVTFEDTTGKLDTAIDIDLMEYDKRAKFIDSIIYESGTTVSCISPNNTLTLAPALVAQIADTKYLTLEDAFAAAKSGDTITLLSDITVDTWNMIWNIEGITLDGNGHTLKVNAIESGQNHDAVFHSAGGNTFKNLTIDLSGVQGNSQAQGFRAFAAAAGDTFDTVTIIGNEHIAYGITTGGTSAANETITIKNSIIKSCGYAIYDAENGSVENLIITGNTISNCDYATILRAANGQFTGNTVTNGKLNIMSENQIVTENTFTAESTIKFYSAPKSFEKNKISENSALACDDNVGIVNVANNYWGGGAPSETQIPKDLKDKITGSDVYYTAPTMQPEDLNTYEPPYTGKYSYEITVAKTENGSVSVDKYATEGEEVTITVTPDKAFKLDELSVTAGGKDVEITNNGDGTYTFTMPSNKVTITASFIEDEDYVEPTPDPNMPFTDVSENDWFYGAVQYVYDNDMMNGVSDTSFAPNSNLTRAMMAAVLYNLEDQPTQADSTFTDVVEGSWYADAVNWAAANDIVSGYGDGIFGPNDNITREQMAAILYRYAEYKGYDVSAVGDLSQFNDADSVSEWANEVMSWAVGAGLINGMGDGSVAPQGTATRAQVATVLMNFCENIAK